MTRTIEEIKNSIETQQMTPEKLREWTIAKNKEFDQIKKKSPSIQEVLAERGTRYGPFTGHARITQSLKQDMRNSPKWDSLTDSQQEALEMIAHKIGRILNGDPNYLDSWIDIIGYTQLVVDELNAQPKELAK